MSYEVGRSMSTACGNGAFKLITISPPEQEQQADRVRFPRSEPADCPRDALQYERVNRRLGACLVTAFDYLNQLEADIEAMPEVVSEPADGSGVGTDPGKKAILGKLGEVRQAARALENQLSDYLTYAWKNRSAAEGPGDETEVQLRTALSNAADELVARLGELGTSVEGMLKARATRDDAVAASRSRVESAWHAVVAMVTALLAAPIGILMDWLASTPADDIPMESLSQPACHNHPYADENDLPRAWQALDGYVLNHTNSVVES